MAVPTVVPAALARGYRSAAGSLSYRQSVVACSPSSGIGSIFLAGRDKGMDVGGRDALVERMVGGENIGPAGCAQVDAIAHRLLDFRRAGIGKDIRGVDVADQAQLVAVDGLDGGKI